MTAATTPAMRTRRSTWHKTQRKLGAVALFVMMGTLAILFVGPFLWTVFSSLKKYNEIYAYPPTIFPTIPQWDNYTIIFTKVPFVRFIYNTTIIAVLTVLGTTLSALTVGYGFSRFRWPGREIAFMLCLATMMLPVEVTLIPTYIGFSKIGWIDTWLPLIVPAWFGGGAFNVFMFRQFFMSIPRELDEAAYIDGAGPFRILWQILVPLCKPAITTVIVIRFIASWNDFLGPLIFLNSTDKYTVSLGMRWFSGEASRLTGLGRPTEQLMMAAVTVAAIPCVIIFLFAQRYFVQGIVTSGFKGV